MKHKSAYRHRALAACTAVLIAVFAAVQLDGPIHRRRASAVVGTGLRDGAGETLVLVVKASTTRTQAARIMKDANARFGHLAGFSADHASAYDVTGVYVQASPDAVALECDRDAGLAQRIVAGERVDVECPPALSAVRVLAPVRLRYVPASRYAADVFPRRCGSTDLPPCQRSRYQAMLGRDLRFAAGYTLVVTAFRTKAGAERFVELARSAGISDLVVVQARKLGGSDVGLGQESHPDGSGPLTGPLIDQVRHQR